MGTEAKAAAETNTPVTVDIRKVLEQLGIPWEKWEAYNRQCEKKAVNQ